jgi:hypothetical protein
MAESAIANPSQCNQRPTKARSSEWDFPEKYSSVLYLWDIYSTRLLQDKYSTLFNKTVSEEKI